MCFSLISNKKDWENYRKLVLLRIGDFSYEEIGEPEEFPILVYSILRNNQNTNIFTIQHLIVNKKDAEKLLKKIVK